MVIEINRVPNRPRTDPRERQEWFRQMDERAQDLVRQRWIEDELDWERVEDSGRRGLKQDLLRGVLLVGGVHTALLSVLAILLIGFTGGISVLDFVHQVLISCLVGAGLGWVWRKTHADVLSCAVSGCLTLVVFEGMVGMHFVFAVCAGFAGGLCGGYLGLRRTELPGA